MLSIVKEVLQNGYVATKKRLHASANEIEDQIHLLTTALSRHCTVLNHNAVAEAIATERPVDAADVGKLKEALIMNRQHERFINELSGVLAELKMHNDKLLKAFREKLNDVHETVKYRIAIPTQRIFVS